MGTLTDMATRRGYQRMPTMTPQARADLEHHQAEVDAAEAAKNNALAARNARFQHWYDQGIEPGEIGEVVGLSRGYVSKRVHGKPVNPPRRAAGAE